MNIDLADLRVFQAVVLEGGVTAAARRLHCVQSNVTARVRILEDRLGAPLFARVRRRLVITPAGERLLTYADRLLALAEEAQSAVTAVGQQTLLRIGAVETVAATGLAPLLTRFHRAAPDVEIDLETAVTELVGEQLARGRIDIGFVIGPLLDADLRSARYGTETLRLITEHDHPPVQGPADLRGRAFLAFHRGCHYRKAAEHWLTDAGVSPRKVLEFGSFQAILSCAAAGVGFAVVPESILLDWPGHDALGVHDLPSAIEHANVLIAWTEQSEANPAVRQFLALAGVKAAQPVAPVRSKPSRSAVT
ncbi:MAG: LysR family transcriptional regulator [Burkholderiales bacterium]|nr:LysR family transcriptional regulator [Burkholderiales bacterium]